MKTLNHYSLHSFSLLHYFNTHTTIIIYKCEFEHLNNNALSLTTSNTNVNLNTSIIMENSKLSLVKSLQSWKRKSGKTYGQIAAETGLTNVYVAQLLRRQAQLKPDTAPKLKAALPGLPDELIEEMMEPPLRSYDPNLIQDPTIYRLNEGIMHFGESIKEIINEEFGDGIMSAIDFYCSVDKVTGVDGKDRVVVTFDGKYLAHSEQKVENMVSRIKRQED